VRVCVIQARAGSTRLPGKVLRMLGDRPVLAWVIDAAARSGACDEIVVATTAAAADDDVAALAEQLGASVARGPVDDVLARYLIAIDAAGAVDDDAVIRLTADCPLLDPRLIAACVGAFDPASVDYVTTAHDHEHALAHGLDVEVVRAGVLRQLDAVATGAHRTHVTSYILSHADAFDILTVGAEPACADLRFTLDEPADAALLEAIVAELGHQASDYRAVVAVLRSRPDLVALNAHVQIKPLAAG
jgi:spore coat polysaccharide biosynthesis protein SpsF